jgi:hypothetical protein
LYWIVDEQFFDVLAVGPCIKPPKREVPATAYESLLGNAVIDLICGFLAV